ncbi:MAG TPA: hypothetical protein VKE69_10685 [Planctomycetota bacterium]|nr:hypothetical protein [Planctomycetota bacterium]
MSPNAPIVLVHALDLEGAPWHAALVGGARRGRRVDGTIAGLPVAIVRCGIGKVAAALATAETIAASGARAVVVAGSAGSLASGVRVGDLVLATETIQHDLGVREGRVVAASTELRAAIAKAARGSFRNGERLHEGAVLTGDRACLSYRRRLRLRVAFRTSRPLAVEMEGAAVAAAAAAAGVPHAVVRVATDRAGPLGALEFRRNAQRLGGRAAEAVVAWLKEGARGCRSIS